MIISLSDRIENIVGKEENAGYQHFLLFPLCFQKPSFSGSFKVEIVWLRVNAILHNPEGSREQLKGHHGPFVNLIPKDKVPKDKILD